VSGQHAMVAFEGGEYVLIDQSTNGTLVNGGELPKGGRVLLRSGDVLGIGNYEITVLVDDLAASGPVPQPAASPAEASFFGSSPTPAFDAGVDPLDFFADPAEALIPDAMPSGGTQSDFLGRGPEPSRSSPASASDHSPAYADFFAPPEVSPDLGPAQGVLPATDPRPSSAAVIPEHWDATGFSDPPGERPRPASGFPDPWAEPGQSESDPSDPRAEPGQPQSDSSDPHRARPRLAAPVPDPPAGQAQVADTSASATRAGLRGARPLEQAGVGGARAQAGDLSALLHAAGLDPAAVDETALASLGEILRVVVEGLMEVLRARAEIKTQFRVAMTTLKPAENNPLKFSVNAEDALFNLFARRSGSFQAPVDAFREAFGDLRAHQVATMAGMRAAFATLLVRFAPDRLQEGFDRGLKRAAFLGAMNKTKYWELYREMYDELLSDDDAAFRRLFGDEFAQAYEEQMQRLSALQHRS
ncbi:MAG TPA: type VI secretion system-associated FHA domain protein TagH, partial [Gammaproteobacteria bacterium]|nr:type VI secretion system-associated FHA domain protein TagH [Gammaproteobacteria bacterium]